jgi:O-antigen/teichoic acid export membrane protein
MLIGLVIKLGLGWWLIARYALAGVYYTQAFTIAVEIICCFVVIGVVIISRRPRFKSVQRWLRLD